MAGSWPKNSEEERDPLRAAAERLQAEFVSRGETGEKLKKQERELLAFLELHPGQHNVAELGEQVKRASEAARALARRGLVRLEMESLRPPNGFAREAPVLNVTSGSGRFRRSAPLSRRASFKHFCSKA